MKITMKTVIEALEHASDKQEAELLGYLNQDLGTWGGILLEQIVHEHIESMEESAEQDAEFDREHKLYLAARGRV